MSQRFLQYAVLPAFMFAGLALGRYPIMEKIADEVIQKDQTSTCEQLWQERAAGKGKPKPEMEQRAIKMLHEDAQMRKAFFSKVSAPIVNWMFEWMPVQEALAARMKRGGGN